VKPRDPIGEETLRILSQANKYLALSAEALVPHLSGRILELGCGNGNLTRRLGRHFSMTAVDLDQGYLDSAQAHGDAPTVNFQRINLLEPAPEAWHHQFDSLLSCQVLEHFPDDRAILKNYLRCLKPGGRVVLQLPAHQFAFSQLDKNLGHYRRYHAEMVENLFRDLDLKPIQTFYFNFVGLLGWLWAGKVRRKALLPAKELSLFNHLAPVALLPDLLTKNFFGLNVIGIAQKEFSE